MYALAHGALAIEKRLEALDVPKLDRATYHDAFGDPALFQTVLKPLLGSERTCLFHLELLFVDAKGPTST